MFGDEIDAITEFDPLTGQKTDDLKSVKIYANSHYVTPRPTLNQAIKSIKEELKLRLAELEKGGRLLEAQRLEQRTRYDIEMLEATGSCAGIENYSRYLTGRQPGEPPPTLFEYIPDNALLFIDESHVSVSQIGGMYRGRLSTQGNAGRIRFPPAILHGQPAAALRGMGRACAPKPSPSRRRRRRGSWNKSGGVRRTGHPPHRPDRSAGGSPLGQDAGRRRARRNPRDRARPATAPWSPCSPSAWPRT